MKVSLASRLLAALTAGLFLAACTTNPYTGEQQISRTAAGAAIGAATGAATGAAIGALAGRSAAKGAMIGAGAGTLAGGAIGAYMDVQEARLRDRLAGTGVGVTRVGNDIVLRMPGNITFETDRADIRPSFFEVLGSVALVVKEYDKTILEIMGHTDSTGTAEYNQGLSTRRAASVGAYLQAQGVSPMRIVTRGFGEQYPIADNASAAGRQANRRVELRLVPLTA